jgi:hypothetical protein
MFYGLFKKSSYFKLIIIIILLLLLSFSSSFIRLDICHLDAQMEIDARITRSTLCLVRLLKCQLVQCGLFLLLINDMYLTSGFKFALR